MKERVLAEAEYIIRHNATIRQAAAATGVSKSTVHGDMTEKLRKIDEVSYVRFASVYREFKDIETFLEELRGLCTGKKKKK